MTRARLRALEQSVEPKPKSTTAASETELPHHQHPGSGSGSTSQQHPKSENRVHFDLNHSGGNEMRKPARTAAARPNSAVASRPNNMHLPSDARQRLEQLVRGGEIKVARFLCKMCKIYEFFNNSIKISNWHF